MPVAAANPSNCSSSSTTYNDWATVHIPQYTQKMRAIRAVMYAPYRIEDCIDAPLGDLVSGPSYWVALTGELGGSGSDIIQIGVIECMNAIRDACNSGGPEVFWAYGGCNGYTPYPRPLTPLPPSGAEFEVERMPSGWYELRMDGVVKASIWKGDTGIVCWADTGDVNAEVSCERWDPGDMCGTSLDKAAAHGIKYKSSVGGTYYGPNLTSGSCFESNSETQCSVIDVDSANFWTAQ